MSAPFATTDRARVRAALAARTRAALSRRIEHLARDASLEAARDDLPMPRTIVSDDGLSATLARGAPRKENRR